MGEDVGGGEVKIHEAVRDGEKAKNRNAAEPGRPTR